MGPVLWGGADVVMDARTIDTICALLTMPLAYRVLVQAEDGEPTEDRFEKVVNHFFHMRKVFEHTYYDKGRNI